MTSPLEKPMSIPKELRYSSNTIQTDVDNARNKIRKNKFDHLNFNSVMDLEEGQRYYRGIYKPNMTFYNKVNIEDVPK